MVKAALDEKEYENFQRINKQIYLYVVNPGVAGPAGYDLTDLATEYGQYWQKTPHISKITLMSLIVTNFPLLLLDIR